MSKMNKNKYIIVSHMILSSKICATDAYLENTLEEARSKAFEIINKHYEEEGYEDDDEPFKIIKPNEDHYDIYMNCIEQYTGNKSFGIVVTITKV